MKRFILSAAIALAGLTAIPAYAGGSIAIEITPQSAEEEQAMRLGLGLISLAMALDSAANVAQNGTGNAAGIAQAGGDDFGLIVQDGANNTGTLNQGAGSNAYGIFQFGEGNDAAVAQSGGDTGILIQLGW